MTDLEWKDWSDGWIREGYYISYLRDGIHYYEFVVQRDFAHWEYDWHETILAGADSGPETINNIEITRGYDDKTNTNHLWQFIFGIKGQVLIYIELPPDIHRHGIAKIPKPSSTNRYVSHFEEYMSPYHEPSFITEHFLMRPECDRLTVSAYNPNAIAMTPILNFMIAKLVTERIGTVQNGTQYPTSARWTDTLDKLYRRLIPQRPITLMPVRMPAEAPGGE